MEVRRIEFILLRVYWIINLIKLSFLFKKICIASDHAGYNLKEIIKDHLINKYVSVFDLGPYEEKSVDYPDYAKKLAKRVNKDAKRMGR